MNEEIIVPVLGESITEATVTKWLKNKGDSVDADEPLVELETDKVNVEVPSPHSGTLSSIKVKEGDTVEVGALLGLVEDKPGSTKNLKKEIKEPSEERKKIVPKKQKIVNPIEDKKDDMDSGEALLLETPQKPHEPPH